MDFAHKKLPAEAAQNLRNIPIREIAPYALLLAPVYAFLKQNAKFIAIKAPLDFFTPEELEKISSMGSVFVTSAIDLAQPFQNAAARARAVLSVQPQDETKLPPSPYELSDALLKIIGPLWGTGPVIEPYFVAVFVNSFCDELPGELLTQARELDVKLYEKALFRSSWAVFLALHLGYCDLAFLNRLRRQVFEQTLENVTRISPVVRETDALFNLVTGIVENSETRVRAGDHFNAGTDPLRQKLASRMVRVKEHFIRKDQPVPTIYGPEGFRNV